MARRRAAGSGASGSKVSVGWRRFNWDLHSAIGFWLFLFMLMWGVSGFYLGVPEPFSNFVDSISDPEAFLGERPGDIVLSWLTRLHFGRWRDMPWLKAIWAFVGLVPALMFVTGVSHVVESRAAEAADHVRSRKRAEPPPERSSCAPGLCRRVAPSLDDCAWSNVRIQSPVRGEVVVRVRAASLNYRDQRGGAGSTSAVPSDARPMPLSDGAGEVVGRRAGVSSRFKSGDRVAGTFFQPAPQGPAALGSPLDGMLAEHVVLHEDGLVAIPDRLSYEEAACLPCAGVTAWHALFRAGRPMKAGDTVLVLGTGGVSISGAAARARRRRPRHRDIVERRQARTSDRAGRLGCRQLSAHAGVGAGGPAAHRRARRRLRRRDRRRRHARSIDAVAGARRQGRLDRLRRRPRRAIPAPFR